MPVPPDPFPSLLLIRDYIRHKAKKAKCSHLVGHGSSRVGVTHGKSSRHV